MTPSSWRSADSSLFFSVLWWRSSVSLSKSPSSSATDSVSAIYALICFLSALAAIYRPLFDAFFTKTSHHVNLASLYLLSQAKMSQSNLFLCWPFSLVILFNSRAKTCVFCLQVPQLAELQCFFIFDRIVRHHYWIFKMQIS